MFDPNKVLQQKDNPPRYPLTFQDPFEAKIFMECHQNQVAELCSIALLEYRKTETLTLRAPNLETLEMIVNKLNF